jgi:hypothetical protein
VERIPLDPVQVLGPIFAILESSDVDPAYKELTFNWLTMNNASGLLDDWRTQEWQIIQRFGASYLYFATNGTGWQEQVNFLMDAKECE